MYPNIAAKMAAVNKRRVDGTPQDGPPQAVPMPIFGPAPTPPPANNGGLLTGGYMKPDMPAQAPPQAAPMPDHGNALASLLGGWNKPQDTGGWYGQDAFPPQAQPWPDYGAMFGNLLGVGGATARGQGVNGGNRSSTYAGAPQDDYRHMLSWGIGP